MRDQDELAASLHPGGDALRAFAPFLAPLVAMYLGYVLGYRTERVFQRHSTVPVACTPNVDSVRGVPTVWPRGPVAGARP